VFDAASPPVRKTRETSWLAEDILDISRKLNTPQRLLPWVVSRFTAWATLCWIRRWEKRRKSTYQSDTSLRIFNCGHAAVWIELHIRRFLQLGHVFEHVLIRKAQLLEDDSDFPWVWDCQFVHAVSRQHVRLLGPPLACECKMIGCDMFCSG
jgi:hypothetical protein